MTLASRVFPLVLLLLLAWTSLTRVLGQEVKVGLVSTHYVEITWIKASMWMGVDDYHVNFTSEGAKECYKTIHCTQVNCSFNSLICGVINPCTPTTTTVTGADHSALPLPLVSAPEKVSNFTTSLVRGVEYISWVNPSLDSSPCYSDTAVRVSFSDENLISYFNHTQESTSKALCVPGYGEVEVWTRGGDGHSNSSLDTIIYNGTSVVDLVTFKTCEPVGCTSIHVEWSNSLVCPDVEYLTVQVGDIRQNVPSNTSDLIVPGLEIDEQFSTCIYATNSVGSHLDYSCHYYCRTPHQVPENLEVKALSEYSLHFTWEPPVCHEPSVVYVLRVDYEDYTTTATEYDVEGLRPFYRYPVELQVGEGYHENEDVATLTAYTLPNSPYNVRAWWTEDSVYGTWDFYTSYSWGFAFYYKVNWGRSLQHERETSNQYLFIRSYNSTDEVYQVCVAAFPAGRKDLMSDTSCDFVSVGLGQHSKRLRREDDSLACGGGDESPPPGSSHDIPPADSSHDTPFLALVGFTLTLVTPILDRVVPPWKIMKKDQHTLRTFMAFAS